MTEPVLLIFEIGFLPVRLWDLLDILIVGYLMYQIYKLLRGNIAFNIFIGVLTLYVVWWLVNELEMELLSAVLDQFVSVGVIVIVIIFQQEVRRFLLFLGNTTVRQRFNFLGRLFDRSFEAPAPEDRQINALKAALLRMSRRKIGALIVLAKNLDLNGLTSPGVMLDGNISEPLIESIFNKSSPLHDGAVIIADGKVRAASCVLPVSENPNLPKSAGLRHRAAVGITERADVAAFVVSEETGKVSIAYEGKLRMGIGEEDIGELLRLHFN